MNSFTDEQIKMLKNMGALGYNARKISSIMSLDFEQTKKDLESPNSDLYKHYYSGADYANYLIDLKLFEMAQAGDIKAIDKLEMRKKTIK